MQDKNTMDQAINQLVKKRVAEAVKEKDIEIKKLETVIETLNKGGAYTVRYESSGWYPYRTTREYTTYYSNDPTIKDHITKYKDELEKQAKYERETLKEDLEKEYKKLEESLKFPWYMKIIFALKRK